MKISILFLIDNQIGRLIITVPGLEKSVDCIGFWELLNSLSHIDLRYSGVTYNKMN